MGTLVCRSGVPSGDTAPRGPGCPDGEEGGGEGGRENIITPFLNKNTLFTRKLLGIQLSSIPLILLNSQAFG